MTYSENPVSDGEKSRYQACLDHGERVVKARSGRHDHAAAAEIVHFDEHGLAERPGGEEGSNEFGSHRVSFGGRSVVEQPCEKRIAFEDGYESVDCPIEVFFSPACYMVFWLGLLWLIWGGHGDTKNVSSVEVELRRVCWVLNLP